MHLFYQMKEITVNYIQLPEVQHTHDVNNSFYNKMLYGFILQADNMRQNTRTIMCMQKSRQEQRKKKIK